MWSVNPDLLRDGWISKSVRLTTPGRGWRSSAADNLPTKVHEPSSDARDPGMRILESILRDIRFALRLMRQTPVVSAVAMLSLALGIGANVAIFNLVNALMLKALPVEDPERLVV